MIKGTLIPIGGNEDKGGNETEDYTLDFIQEGILAHVVRESGGKSANIVVIPTASSIPVEVGKSYLAAFDQLGCENVNILNLDQRSQSSEKDYLKWVAEADCVMFSGGDQSQIIDKIAGTPMHDLLLDRYRNENFVIAGTSAGAMCMSSEMIMGGSSSESLFKGAVKMREGMRLMPDLIIDSHFIMRGRFGRLTEAVSRFPNLLGVGLAEDTGLIIKNGNDCTVIGSGMVIVFDGSSIEHNNEKVLEEGTPMTITNMTTHVLSNSDSFYLDQRKAAILPIDAEFI